tara:strand:- start:39 stop:227 length:189 start_codon:yes stop_codon:yes gene_type:complete
MAVKIIKWRGAQDIKLLIREVEGTVANVGKDEKITLFPLPLIKRLLEVCEQAKHTEENPSND